MEKSSKGCEGAKWVARERGKLDMVQLSPILAGLGPGQSNGDMGRKNGHMTPKEGRRGLEAVIMEDLGRRFEILRKPKKAMRNKGTSK